MTKIKSMAKIAAVSVMSVIISISFNGCGFFDSMLGGDSTSAQSSSSSSGTAKSSDSGILSSLFDSDEKESNTEREKCESNEIKNNSGVVIAKGECELTLNGRVKNGVWKYYDDSGYIVIKEITYKKGVLDGVSKEYNKDEILISETNYKDGIANGTQKVYDDKGKLLLMRSYKNGKLNGTATIYDKKALNGFTKGTVDYVDDKMVVSRIYMDNSIVYFQQVLTEGNVEIDRTYHILREISKDLNKTILPKLQAKYEKALNDAIKKDDNASEEFLECLAVGREIKDYDEGKKRIRPSAQTFKKAEECNKNIGSLGFGGAMNRGIESSYVFMGADGAETRKVKAQIIKEYNTALDDELKKNSGKFSDDNKVIAYIKNKYPESETVARGTFKMITETKTQGFVWTQTQVITTKLYQNNSELGTINHNIKNTQESCVASGSGNCRAFSRQFKELIDKSAFKDTIYNLLPKPRNQ